MNPLTALVVSEGDLAADNLYTALRQSGVKAWQVRPEALAEGLFLDLRPDLLLLHSELADEHIGSIRASVDDRDLSVTMVAFGEHDSERLPDHLASGLDFLVSPFVPELVKHRLSQCHQNRVLNETLDEINSNANLLKYEQELQIGREIQRGFLPAALPEADGWDLQVRFTPAREVAGDFYDSFYLVNGRRIGMVIADVCDKGVGAALFMALIRTLIRHTATHGANAHPLHVDPGLVRPGESRADDKQTDDDQVADELTASGALLTVGAGTLLSSVTGTDGYMTSNHLAQGYFATMFFGVLDPLTGHVIYINGGHNPPVLLTPTGERTLLHPTGPAVGILPGSSFAIGEFSMNPGDVLFLYTDGVTEARAPDGDFFGEERMYGVLEGQAVTSSAELLDQMDAALIGHIGTADQFDDITMMALVREPVDRA